MSGRSPRTIEKNAVSRMEPSAASLWARRMPSYFAADPFDLRCAISHSSGLLEPLAGKPASSPKQDRGCSGGPIFDRCFQITDTVVCGRCSHHVRIEPFATLSTRCADRSLIGSPRATPPQPEREPSTQPRDPHRRGHPSRTRHTRTRLLLMQAGRREVAERSDALLETTYQRRHLPTTTRRRATLTRTRGPGREGTQA